MTAEDFPLPDWATGRCSTWCVGAQLRTRDGRRIGNAVITRRIRQSPDESPVWVVVTDTGNELALVSSELDELFFDPEFTMNPDTAPGVRIRNPEAWTSAEKVVTFFLQERRELAAALFNLAHFCGASPLDGALDMERLARTWADRLYGEGEATGVG
jgi:hypothetical protein